MSSSSLGAASDVSNAPEVEFTREVAEFVDEVFSRLPARAQEHKGTVGALLAENLFETRESLSSATTRENMKDLLVAPTFPEKWLSVMRGAVHDVSAKWERTEMTADPLMGGSTSSSNSSSGHGAGIGSRARGHQGAAPSGSNTEGDANEGGPMTGGKAASRSGMVYLLDADGVERHTGERAGFDGRIKSTQHMVRVLSETRRLDLLGDDLRFDIGKINEVISRIRLDLREGVATPEDWHSIRGVGGLSHLAVFEDEEKYKNFWLFDIDWTKPGKLSIADVLSTNVSYDISK